MHGARGVADEQGNRDMVLSLRPAKANRPPSDSQNMLESPILFRITDFKGICGQARAVWFHKTKGARKGKPELHWPFQTTDQVVRIHSEATLV